MNLTNPSEAAIFDDALACATLQERTGYLDRACARQPELRQRIEMLLAAHDQAAGFLENSHIASTHRIVPPTGLPETQLGERIGRYKLLQKIGEGGCGVVYMAEQEEPVRRLVALKVIKLGMDTKQVIARFEAERQALALMDHPNIARVLDVGATDTGRPFFVMELVKGIPATRYADENMLGTRKRLNLFIQICQAVQHAHQKGIIHRDLKPSNILVADHDGIPVSKVIDFGIAKSTTDQRLTDKTVFTALEQFIGTPAYMSPEQARLSGLDVDTRSDIYSLGVLLYELLTGKTPFDARRLLDAGFDEIRRIIREEEPPKPSTRLTQELLAADVNSLQSRGHNTGNVRADSRRLLQEVEGDLDWIVMKCLEKDRTRRYETANGLALDITRYLNSEPIQARPPTQFYRLQKMVRRNRAVVTVVAGIGLTALCGAVVSTYLYFREVKAHNRTLAAEQEQSRLRATADTALKREATSLQAAIIARNSAELSELKSRTVLDFFTSNVVYTARPRGEGGLGHDVTVRRALEVAEAKLTLSFTNQPLAEAELRSAFGFTYLTLGELPMGITQYQRSKELLEQMLGPDDRLTIEAKAELAYAYEADHRFKEAKGFWIQSVNSAIKTHGLAARRTIELMSRLGVIYRILGDNSNAVRTLMQSVELSQNNLGSGDSTTLEALNHLGFTYLRFGRLPEAAATLERVVRLTPETNHLAVTCAMIDLARVYQKQGKWDKAQPLYKEALESRRRHFGDNHSSTLLAMDCVAEAFIKAGLHDQAVTLFKEALERREITLGSEHRDTVATRNRLITLAADANH